VLDEADRVPRGTTIRTDVCIVGAGAAGITVALGLADTRHDVVLLESGGTDFEVPTHELAQGEASGLSYDVGSARLRFLGGSTNHWAGLCRPLNPIDFEARDWVPWSGWPIRRADLDPCYERAQSLCDLGPARYDLDYWQQRVPDAPPLLRGETVTTELFQQSPPTLFGQKFRPDLRRAGNLRVLLHANARNIRTRRGRIEGVDVATLAGNELAVDAPVVVLALGGLDNPRLMLASRDEHPSGVGNEHDLVGRFFMEHPHYYLGRAVLERDPSSRGRLMWGDGGVPIRGTDVAVGTRPPTLLGFLAPTEATTRRLRLCACGVSHVPLRDVAVAERAEELPGGVSDADVRELIGELRGTTGGDESAAGEELAVFVLGEQVPNPESRVTLSERIDALGVPKLDLHWVLDDRDWDHARRCVELVADQLGKAGLGRMSWQAEQRRALRYGRHHLGTTRMHADPTRGVVDADGQVHGVDGLFVAGSSVFPTGGYVNPTLTIVALAVRLAAHVRRRLTS